MWSEGTIGIPDAADKNKYTACHYWVKHYDEPTCKEAELALCILLNNYN